jgi:hypothetical protein
MPTAPSTQGMTPVRRTRVARKDVRAEADRAARDLAAPRAATVTSRGGPVPPHTTAVLRPSFGHDFAIVRIFADDTADLLARSMEASAFTVGQDVFFAQGAYDPNSPRGLHLLTHELAHTVQQREATGPPTRIGGDNEPNERQARTAADAVLSGQTVSVGSDGGASAVVAREPAADKETEAQKAARLAGQFPWMRALFPSYTTTLSSNGLQAQKTDGMTTVTRTADVTTANGGGASIGQRRVTEADKNTAMESSQSAGYDKGAFYAQYGNAGRSLADDGTKVADSQTTRITAGPDTLGVSRSTSATRDTVTTSSERELMLKDGKVDASLKSEREFALDENNKLSSSYAVKAGSEGVSYERGRSSRITDSETGVIDSSKTSTTVGYNAKEGVSAGMSKETSTEVGGETFKSGKSGKISTDSASFTSTKSHTQLDAEGNKQTDSRATTVGISGEGASVGQVHTDAKGNTTATKVTGKVGVDAQGNITDVSATGSYTRNGKTVSAGAGYAVHVTEPHKVGKVFVVEWERVFTAHGGAGAKGAGVSGEYDSKRFGSRSFPTEPEAKAFYDQAEAMAPSLAVDPTTAGAATQLAIGETRGTGESSKVGASASVSPTAGSIGVSGEHGSSSSVEVRRISETVFDLTRDASTVNGGGFNASTVGVGASHKSYGKEGARITVSIDISTPMGAAAYELYARSGVIMFPARVISQTEYEEHGSSTTSFVPGAQSTWSGHTEHSMTQDAAGSTERFAGETSQTASSSIPFFGSDSSDMGVRLEETEVNHAQSFYSLYGHVNATSGEESSKDLAKITGMVRDTDTQGEMKSSGNWKVEVEITPELIEQFLSTVGEERIREIGIFESADARNELRQNLQAAKTSADKKRALAQFFADAGYDGRAIGAMRNAIYGVKNQWQLSGDYKTAVQNQLGNFEYDLTLPGDRNFQGTAGRLALEGKIGEFTKALADNPAAGGSLHGAIYATLEEVRRQHTEISDPRRYTDLPRQLRETQVARLDKYIAQLTELAAQAGVAFTEADAAAAAAAATAKPEPGKGRRNGKGGAKQSTPEHAAPVDPATKALMGLRARIGGADQALQNARADYQAADVRHQDYVKQYLHVISQRSKQDVHKAYVDSEASARAALALKASAEPQLASANELRSQFIQSIANPETAQGIGAATLGQLMLVEGLWSSAADKMSEAVRPLSDIVNRD